MSGIEISSTFKGDGPANYTIIGGDSQVRTLLIPCALKQAHYFSNFAHHSPPAVCDHFVQLARTRL
jgi:hypothetical protein